nr:MAG TPA: hypothetical protein [Caudoviricetes sp.]
MLFKKVFVLLRCNRLSFTTRGGRALLPLPE